MFPREDASTAVAWRDLAIKHGRRVCHGSAHEANPEVAWLASGWDDFKLLLDSLGFAAPQFFSNSARLRGPDLGRALDFGAGAGRVAVHMAAFCSSLTCVDASPDLLEDIPPIPNVRREVVRDPAKLSQFGDFDTIASLHVMYSMTPAGLAHALHHIGRVAKLGARVALDIPWTNGVAHEDKDGCPGGWWVHDGGTVVDAATLAGLVLVKAPPPVAKVAWSSLARPMVWRFQKVETNDA